MNKSSPAAASGTSVFRSSPAPPDQQPNANPFSSASAPNPFASTTEPSSQTPASNPFATVKKQRSKSPFVDDSEQKLANPFSDASATKTSSATSQSQSGINGIASNVFGVKASNTSSSSAQVTGRGRATQGKKSAINGKARPSIVRADVKGPQSEFAARVYKQLAKDRVTPPKWPSDPGAIQQKGVMDDLRQAHKEYREKARKSLMKADLIDDPDKRRRLDEALPFKGICDEMCPEWEKIQRITENGVSAEEKEELGDQTRGSVIPRNMVKRLARSAAGQEAGLPMDVRSAAACRRSLDYLIEELISSDDRLPANHGFVWNRTRAIRIDLSVQTPSMTSDEIKDEIYCLENIVRFHATSAHLLARPGVAAEDYVEQQEAEQLSKSLMTLNQRYKDCTDMGITCENELEFRAYYILFFAWNSSLKDTVESWGTEISTSEAIQTALCIVEAMQNTSMRHGPLKPDAPTEIAANAASMFFSIIASPQISYVMACIAEVHFGVVRRSILRTILRAYSRPKGAPKDLTPEFLRRQLRFDSIEDTVAFVEQHGLLFQEENGQRHVAIGSRQNLDEPRLKQSFSHDLVERKRNKRPYADTIRETIYEDTQANGSLDRESDQESLFVDAQTDSSTQPQENEVLDSELEDSDAIPLPASQVGSPAPHTLAGTGTSGFGSTSPNSNPFSSRAASGNELGSVGNLKPDSPFGAFPKSPSPAISAADGAKKVTFGENTVKLIPNRADLSNVTNSNDAPQGLFSSLNHEDKPAPVTMQSKAKAPSWFPSNLPDKSKSLGNKDAGSILPAASPSVGSGFMFPTSTSLSTPAPGSTRTEKLSSTPIVEEPAKEQTIAGPSPTVQFLGTSSTVAPARTEPSLAAPLFRSIETSEKLASPPTFTSHDRQAATPPLAPLTLGAEVSPPKPKEDPFVGLTNWFINGDQGFMRGAEEWVVRNLLQDIWDDFQEMEQERIRKEEDERSWAEARKYRTYSLRIRYFYRWLDTFRRRRVVKRIKMEKEKLRQWKAPENVVKRREVVRENNAKRQREVVDGLRQSAKNRAVQEDRLRRSTRSQDSVEDALLASGILNGVRDERAAARHAALNEDENSTELSPSELRHQQENRRREKHGLPPWGPRQSQTDKVGTKTAKLRALAAGRDSLSMSTGSMRNSAYSSSYRSSLGINSSRVLKAKKSRVSDPYWRMKAHGLVQMPNGEYLHESLALPMLRDGKRFPGLGDFGIGAAVPDATSPLPPLPDELFDESPTSPAEKTYRSRVSMSPSIASNASFKRKRILHHEESEDEDLAAYRSEPPSIHKRAKSSGSINNEPDLLAQMQSLLNDVQAEGRRLSQLKS